MTHQMPQQTPQLQARPIPALFLILAILAVTEPSPVASAETAPAQTGPQQPAQPSIEFDRFEGELLYFKNNASTFSVKTPLLNPSYLGKLIPSGSTASSADGESFPYFLFEAKTCDSCPLAVHAVKADPANPAQATSPTTFVYPGKIIDKKKYGVIFQSRAFFGRCLPRKGDVYVSFQRELTSKRRGQQPSVYFAEATKSGFEEQLIERHMPSIKETLRRVKAKQCVEISGQNRAMGPQTINLSIRGIRSNAAEEEDDDEVSSNPADPADPAKPAQGAVLVE